ncbi:MAG: beta-ketoacyl synthase [Bacteroidales bacterium]|nr:beta-ketoacyl synthase [Bacteroidales bacterium]
MTVRTAILSDYAITPLAFGSEENLSAYLEGRSCLRRHVGTFGIQDPFYASLFDREQVEAEAVKAGIPENYSFFEKVAILAAGRAIEASGTDPASPRTAFIISSTKGNIERLDNCPGEAPLDVPAARIASFFGNPSTPVVVSVACISGLAALIHARRLLTSSTRYDRVVVCGAEAYCGFFVSGFQCLKALSANRCRPFCADRDGLNLGEAAACMVLGRSDDTQLAPWEIVCGAVRNDANHISGPSRTGEGSYNCLRAVLPHCEERPAFVSVHGTGTAYNDEMESVALSRAGLLDVPVCAMKSVFGHTMGAAGILESILSIKSLDKGLVLPTPGFTGGGVSYPVDASPVPRLADGNSFIKLLSGFGGCNAAALFRKGGAR